jgi:hypothetical protein
MSGRIVASLEAMPDLLDLAAWTQDTPEGRVALASLETINRLAYPDAWAEMEGIAAGSGAPREVVLATNLAQELEGLRSGGERGGGVSHRSKQLEKHCTDVHLLRPASTDGGSPAVSALAHNEDDEQGAAANGYLVVARVGGGQAAAAHGGYEYCGFAYPGALVGWAWGFGGGGVGQTVNAMSPANQTAGRACAVAARDLLQASSLADAVSRLDVGRLGAGLSYNLGAVAAAANGGGHGEELLLPHYNVETSPLGNDVLKLELNTNASGGSGGGDVYYYHTNVYLHDPATSDVGAQDSSWHRLARLNALPHPASLADLVARLGDVGDVDFPIYRNETPPDYATTLNSVLLDFGVGTASVWPFYTGEVDEWKYIPGFGAAGVAPRYVFDLRAGFESWVQTAASAASGA